MSVRHYKLSLPEWAHYTAQDGDGAVWAYQRKPEPNHEEGCWDDRADGKCQRLNFTLVKNSKWYETLKSH